MVNDFKARRACFGPTLSGEQWWLEACCFLRRTRPRCALRRRDGLYAVDLDRER